MLKRLADRRMRMPVVSTERARWLAAHILPLEPQLRGWLRRVTTAGLEVDDLIQEAYAKLAGLATVSKITQPKAYVYQIVKRLISDHIRRANVVSIEAAAEAARFFVLDEGLTPERILSGRQELDRLYKAIARLPGPCRSVFVMRKFDDKPQKAIAAELRISENIVEKRMSRALRMILEQLQADERELENGSRFDRTERKDRRDA
jgi:RNA polymerase sigma factor (sigma-70 family)